MRLLPMLPSASTTEDTSIVAGHNKKISAEGTKRMGQITDDRCHRCSGSRVKEESVCRRCRRQLNVILLFVCLNMCLLVQVGQYSNIRSGILSVTFVRRHNKRKIRTQSVVVYLVPSAENGFIITILTRWQLSRLLFGRRSRKFIYPLAKCIISLLAYRMMHSNERVVPRPRSCNSSTCVRSN